MSRPPRVKTAKIAYSNVSYSGVPEAVRISAQMWCRSASFQSASLIAVPGTEGRAAAPFTYGMINDEAAVRYAIELNEDCETFVCWDQPERLAAPMKNNSYGQYLLDMLKEDPVQL